MITCLILPAMAAGMERNSPTVFNAALQDMQFWDGRTKDVEQQAGRHVMNPAEMGIPHKGFLVNRPGGIKAQHKKTLTAQLLFLINIACTF
jgi:cytochrome c peroxidase